MISKKKMGFSPIAFDEYVSLYLKNNPGTPREEIVGGLRDALADHKAGKRCDCGNEIWVLGSAVAGNACFACITGEARPNEDYEIDEAM